jgi:capsular exopolysaccharide synthesis family protein
MNARAYLRAIRKSWWVVVVCVIVGALGGYVYSKAQTPLYACKLTFYVGTPALTGPTANADATNQFAQDRATSYAALVSSDRLAQEVIDQDGIPLEARQLSREITASAQLNTILIDVTVTDPSRAQALKIGGAIGDLFPVLVDELDQNTAGASPVSLEVVSGPSASNAPVSPLTRVNTLLGIAIGLLIGVGLAISRELLDVTVRSADALAEVTDAPLLGSIAYDSTVRTQPLVVQDATYSTRAETLRQLRTNLQFIDAARPARVLVITSAVAGEGKSLVAVNLSLVTAETGRKVLVIEADMRKPRISELLGLDGSVGLSTVLAGQADFDSVVQRWGTTGMDVLSSGLLPPNPSELLDGPRMGRLLEALRERYDLVVIDAPPLVPVTDGAIVAAKADGAVMVIRHGRTRRGHLRSAVAALDGVHARLLGCVLNMALLSRADRRGYAAYLKGEPESGRWTSLRRRIKAWRPDQAAGWVPAHSGRENSSESVRTSSTPTRRAATGRADNAASRKVPTGSSPARSGRRSR